MKEQNPFSLYDFFGYLIPGSLCLVIIYFIEQLQNGFDPKCILLNMTFTPSLVQSIILIIISYFIGHILNFLSSATVEKYSFWKYDYPSKYLMRINHGEKYFRGPFHIQLWRFMVGMVLIPIVIGDYFFGNKLKFKDIYVRPLDVFLIDSVKIKAERLFQKLNLNRPSDQMRTYDYHRIFAHYVLQNSDAVNGKTSNYLALYGYLRCMSLILSISFWIAILNMIKAIWEYNTIKEYIDGQTYVTTFIFVTFLMCYLSFMAFMKFYRRYSLENLMTIITMDI